MIDWAKDDEELNNNQKKVRRKSIQTTDCGGVVMGLREGYKDKYYLYTLDGWKMCSVIPWQKMCSISATMQVCTFKRYSMAM